MCPYVLKFEISQKNRLRVIYTLVSLKFLLSEYVGRVSEHVLISIPSFTLPIHIATDLAIFFSGCWKSLTECNEGLLGVQRNDRWVYSPLFYTSHLC